MPQATAAGFAVARAREENGVQGAAAVVEERTAMQREKYYANHEKNYKNNHFQIALLPISENTDRLLHVVLEQRLLRPLPLLMFTPHLLFLLASHFPLSRSHSFPNIPSKITSLQTWSSLTILILTSRYNLIYLTAEPINQQIIIGMRRMRSALS